MSVEGLRERKRRETRHRIAKTALQLFLENGYEATTLEDIAREAGISRRTFFSYFESKDDLMLAWQEASWNTLCAELLAVSPDEEPLQAVRKTFLAYVSRFELEEMRAIDVVMRASKTLQARKQVAYAGQEESLFDTLCQVWRQPQRRSQLRMVAMLSIGVLRLAIEAYGQQPGRSAASHLDEVFTDLDRVLASM